MRNHQFQEMIDASPNLIDAFPDFPDLIDTSPDFEND